MSSADVAKMWGRGSGNSAQKGKTPMVWTCEVSSGGYSAGNFREIGSMRKEIIW